MAYINQTLLLLTHLYLMASGLKLLMEEYCLASAQILFMLADAVWRTEASKILRCEADDCELDRTPEGQGEPGTLLRTAYEVRERARLRYERGYAKLNRCL